MLPLRRVTGAGKIRTTTGVFLRQRGYNIEWGGASTGVHLLLNILDKKSEQIAPTLKSKAGGTMVDVVEGSPSLIVMVDTDNRDETALIKKVRRQYGALEIPYAHLGKA